MKLLISILTLLFFAKSFGQLNFDKSKISYQTEKIVVRIEKINELMGSAVGYAGVRPEQYDYFIQLQNKATKDELVELTNHPNGVVRCYSIWALSHDTTYNLFPIVRRHIRDDKLINTQFGCIGSREKVGDFFISLVTPEYVDLDSRKLNNVEFEQLDSLLIYTPNTLYARTEAINRARLTEQLYSRIREIIVKEKKLSALPVLAKFQKEQDIELILDSRENEKDPESGYFYTYQAIINFPRPEFVPLLERNLKNTLDETHFDREWRYLYAAIAAYKDDKAVELLKIPFTKVQHQDIKEYHLDFVYSAVLEYNDKHYNDILWKLWEEGQNITVRGYKYYLASDPSRTYSFTIKELTGKVSKELKLVPVYDDSIFTEDLEETMLNLVLRNDKELACQIIEQQIQNSEVLSFPIYSSLAVKLKDQRFIKPLFTRLEKEWNAHVYLRIVEALILYNDETINKQILSTRKINPNLNNDWGSKNLDEILKKNNIK